MEKELWQLQECLKELAKHDVAVSINTTHEGKFDMRYSFQARGSQWNKTGSGLDAFEASGLETLHDVYNSVVDVAYTIRRLGG